LEVNASTEPFTDRGSLTAKNVQTILRIDSLIKTAWENKRARKKADL